MEQTNKHTNQMNSLTDRHGKNLIFIVTQERFLIGWHDPFSGAGEFFFFWR